MAQQPTETPARRDALAQIDEVIADAAARLDALRLRGADVTALDEQLAEIKRMRTEVSP